MRQWLAIAALVVTLFLLEWSMPVVFTGLPWNAYLPLPLVLATVPLAWAVAQGHFIWSPPAVVVASLAAQCHLLFLVPEAVVIGTACVVGLASTYVPALRSSSVDGPRRLGSGRWMAVGLVVGLLCWLPPFVQEVGPAGNLSAILSRSSEVTLGAGIGLRLPGHVFSFPPLWATRIPSTFFGALDVLKASSPWGGLVVMGTLAVVGTIGMLRGRQQFGSLALMTAGLGAALAWTFTIFPSKNAISLGYLINVVWILVALEWWVACWGIGMCGRSLSWRVLGSRPRTPRSVWIVPWCAAFVTIGVAAVALVSVVRSPADINWNTSEQRVVDHTVSTIETSPRQPVNVHVTGGGVVLDNNLTEAIAYRLVVDGWSPQVERLTQSYTGLPGFNHQPGPSFTLELRRGSIVAISRQPIDGEP